MYHILAYIEKETEHQFVLQSGVVTGLLLCQQSRFTYGAEPIFLSSKEWRSSASFFSCTKYASFPRPFPGKNEYLSCTFFLTAPNHEGSEEQFREMAKKIAHQISTFSLEHSHFSDP